MNAIQEKLNKVKALYPHYEAFLDFVAAFKSVVASSPSYTFGISNLGHTQLIPIVGFGDRILDSGFAPDLVEIAKKHQDLSLNNHLDNFWAWTETFKFKPYFNMRTTAKSGPWEKALPSPDEQIKIARDIFKDHALSSTHELKVFYTGTTFINFYFIEIK